MEFWGAEVKAGDSLKVEPGEDMVLHLSQACLGEIKKEKGNESVCLFVNVEGKKLVLGTLFSEKLPQQQFDLVFDEEFELSHNWKNGSVYFYGYRASNPFEEDYSGSDSDQEEEDVPLVTANPVNPEPKTKSEKPAEADKAVAATSSKGKESSGKQKVKIVEPAKEEESSDDVMSEDDDDSENEDEDEDDSDDESAESEEETPKKAEPSKKRALDSATKTPVQEKKAKVTPQKTDGKKVSGHVATPYPAKAAKTPAIASTQKTPQSSVVCKSCSKTFGTDKALESHTKAKHTAAKK